MGSDNVPRHGITAPIAKNIVRAWLSEYGDPLAPVIARRSVVDGLTIRVHGATGVQGHYQALREMALALNFHVEVETDPEASLKRAAVWGPPGPDTPPARPCPHSSTVPTGRTADEVFSRCVHCGARLCNGR